MEKKCVECGNDFKKNVSDSKKYWCKKKFCSIKCSSKNRISGSFIKCALCGEKAYRLQSSLKRNSSGKFYCTKECRMNSGEKWHDGIEHTEKTKEVIRQRRASQVIPKESYIKRGIKFSGENHHNWNGGRMMSEGYVLIMDKEHPNRSKSGYVREHRLVAEKALGRYLTKTEVVHHINEIKNDNRVENLYLFQNRAGHKNYHQLFKLGKVEEITKSNLV